MSKESNMGLIVKNAGIDTFGTGINIIITFFASVVITRTIGAELFGKYSLANSIFQVLSVFAIFGMNAGVVKLTSKYNARQDPPAVKGTLMSGIVLTAAISAVIVVAVVFLSPLLATKVFSKAEGLSPILRIFIIALPFYSLMLVINGYTQGLKTLKYTVLVELISRPLIRLAAVVLLFLIGWRLFGVIVGTIFAYVVATLMAFHFAKKVSPFNFKRTRVRPVYNELFFYSLPLVFSRFMNVIMARSNTILVGYFEDPTSIGLFGAVAQLAPFVSLGLVSFTKIFSPVIADLWERNNLEELKSTFKTVSKWVFSIGLPVFIVLMVFAPSLLSVFGPEFAGAATTLRLMAVGQILTVIIGPLGYLLAMTGRQKLNLVNAIALAAVNVVLNIVMIPRWGIAGAGLASTISVVAINLARLIQVKRIYGFTPFRRDIYKPALAAAIAAAVFYFLRLQLGWEDIGRTLLLSAACVVVYASLLYVFGLREEKEILLEILRRRKRA
ncbi:MAG: flippase [Candidatus Eisenbacteria bacterium]